MKHKLVRFTAGFLFLFLLLFLLFPVISVSAETSPSPSPDVARAFALYNTTTGRLLILKNPDETMAPASTVKLMSGLVLCELLKAKTDEWVTITAEMLSGVDGKKMGLTVGKSLKISDLLYAAFSCGCNDAVTALAIITVGSAGELVNRMNARAEQLGMSMTHYTNITGLDSEMQRTTLRDTVKVATAAAENELYLTVSSAYSYRVQYSDGTAKTVYGTNKLLDDKSIDYYSRSVRGLNAGSTGAGGYCVAAYGKYGGTGYIAVAMGCGEEENRFALIQDSLQWAYDNYKMTPVLTKGSHVGEAEVSLAADDSNVSLVLSEDLLVYSDADGSHPELRYSLVVYENKLKAPLENGMVVGKYLAFYENSVYASADVTVSGFVEPSGFLGFIETVKGYLTGRAFLATLIFGIVATLFVCIIPKIKLAKRQKNRRYVRSRGGFKLK